MAGLRWTQEFPGMQEFAVGSLLLKRVPGRLEMQRAVQLLICVKNDVCVLLRSVS